MAEWYYEQDGTHRGPVAEVDLNVMLANRLIDPSTRVWTASFGQAWKHAFETQLQMPAPTTPPPLPQGANSQPHPVAAVAPPVASVQAAIVCSNTLTEKWAMWLACSPLIFLAVDIILASVGIDPYGGSSQARGATLWCGIGSFVLAYKDASTINAAGRNPQHRWLLPFMLLMPVGYFLRRWYVAATPLTPLWIWLVSVVVYAMGAGALSTQ
ncbi:DUF4339 domain-containing protein [Mesorhizobium sp. M0145]|uniref:DUF4339 domain-containing protein n=1 Tax=Mesorhizobium sp. M0145 TaxID=2956895 RepID=UPI00333ACF19